MHTCELWLHAVQKKPHHQPGWSCVDVFSPSLKKTEKPYLVKGEIDNFADWLQQSGSSAWCCRLGSHAWSVSVNPFSLSLSLTHTHTLSHSLLPPVHFVPLGRCDDKHTAAVAAAAAAVVATGLDACHPRHTSNKESAAATRWLSLRPERQLAPFLFFFQQSHSAREGDVGCHRRGAGRELSWRRQRVNVGGGTAARPLRNNHLFWPIGWRKGELRQPIPLCTWNGVDG